MATTQIGTELKGNKTSKKDVLMTYDEYKSGIADKLMKSRVEKEYELRMTYEKKFQKDAQKLAQKNLELDHMLRKKQAKEEADEEKKRKLELLELESKYADKRSERLKATSKVFATKLADNFGEGLKKALSSAIPNITRAFDASIKQYAGLYAQYQSSINARLQGTNLNFQGMSSNIRSNLAMSPYVKQTAVLENLSKLVEQGIAYNVEQRAFIASVSDKIATTFDAFDSSLLQIIRIQQADTTVARLGMEAYLTKYLNSMFSDTSYLSSGGYSGTTGSLLGASALMGRNKSVEFEYIVQKWLGSMSSVGASSSLVQSLAQGLGYLGSGDIASLSSNEALQNLLVMASGKAGLSYSSMLSRGITPDEANRLLASIVQFGGDLSGTGNYAARSQIGGVFGISMADIQALSSLSSSIQDIARSTLTYGAAVRETDYQLTQVSARMHISEKIQNIFDNAMATVGGGIANNPATYATWLVTDLIEQATGGINIPTVGALGNFVDMNATVTQLMKLGIVGAGTLGQIGNIVNALSNGGSLSLTNWGGSDYTSRGKGFAGTSVGISSTTSASSYVGNSSSSDIYNQTVTAANEKAKETISGQEEDPTLMRIKMIAELLDGMSTGMQQMHVVVDNYGLTM